jgi:5-methylcytosine-specific restriction endonuclease McrA
MKTCTKCGVSFPATVEFFYSHRGGLHPRCKGCVREQVGAYRKTNPEKALAVTAKWRKEHPERVLAHKARYRVSHRDFIHGRYSAYTKLYYQEHRERYFAHARNRRARELGASGVYTTEDMRRQYAAQQGRCFWCDIEIAFSDSSPDHLIPLIMGGSNGPENIVCSCWPCNRRKGAKDPMDFLNSLL